MATQRKVTDPGYEATKINLPESQNVENTVARMTSDPANSPLLQSAQTGVKQQFNDRGMLNSAMMAGESQKAVIANAVPIASQDASLRMTQAQSNQQAQNQALSQTLTGAQNLDQIDASRDAEAALMDNRYGHETNLAQTRGDIDRQNIGAQRDADALLQESRYGFEGQLAQTRGEIDRQNIAANRDADALLQQSRYGFEGQLAQTRGEIDRQNIGAQRDAEAALIANRAGYEQALQQMRGDQAKELSLLETQSQQLVQSSQSAAAYFSSHTQALADIMANENIPPEQKQQLVDQQINLLKTGLTVIGSIVNIDMVGLLDFGPTQQPAQQQGQQQGQQQDQQPVYDEDADFAEGFERP
jgi:hypothetical protein